MQAPAENARKKGDGHGKGEGQMEIDESIKKEHFRAGLLGDWRSDSYGVDGTHALSCSHL